MPLFAESDTPRELVTECLLDNLFLELHAYISKATTQAEHWRLVCEVTGRLDRLPWAWEESAVPIKKGPGLALLSRSA
jgi:hypothetical protein